MALYFLRHGDTFTKTQNSNMTVAQAAREISLSELGIQQVSEVILPRNLDCIVISDSLRTKQTAEILLKENQMNIPVIVDKRLHPWESGAEDWRTYWKRYASFIENSEAKDIPYESRESLLKRLNSVIEDYSNKEVLIIAHSILLSNYLGKKFLPFAELIKVR